MCVEEVFVDVGVVFCFVVLVFVVDDFVYVLLQQVGGVFGEQWVLEVILDDFVDVLFGVVEYVFQFLDDFGVIVDWVVEVLQVVVDDEDQVVQFFVVGQGDCVEGFWFVVFVVVYEVLDFLFVGGDEIVVFQVFYEVCLVDCLDWVKVYGYGGELLEVWYQLGVWIGGQVVVVYFLVEVFQLFFVDVVFEEGVGVDVGGCVVLEEYQVVVMFVGGSLEEIVEVDVVEGC